MSRVCTTNCVGYANIASTLSFPKNPNQNEYVEFDIVDTPDFSLNGSHIICNNPGNWNLIAQYQLVNFQENIEQSGSEIDGWVRLNGVDITDSDATNSVNNVGGVNVLCISVCLSLNQNDSVEWGIRSSSYDTSRVVCGIKSYIANSGIVAPSIILTAQKLLDDSENFKNYANIYSTINGPVHPNKNEVMEMNYIDSNDFCFDGSKIICKNSGKWNFLTQYQGYGYNTTDLGVQSQLDGWFRKNGVDIPGSDAAWSCTLKNEVGVLSVAAVIELNEGDYVEIGVRSSSLDGNLNVGSVGFVPPTGIRAPSVILTAFKVKSLLNDYSNYANISCFTDAPLVSNTNSSLFWDATDTNDFSIDGSKLIVKNGGKWSFLVQYQLYNYAKCLTGPNGIIDGWVRLNGVDVLGSDASTSSSVLSGVNVLPIAGIFELKEGDYIEFCVRCSSIDNLLTTGVKTFLPPSEVRAPTVILTCSQLE